jgi:hypothetical protein
MPPVTPFSRKPPTNLDAELQRLVDAEFDDLGRAEKRAPTSKADVIDLRPPSEEQLPQPPFSEEEQAFIARAVFFLRSRANADMLIDDISARAFAAEEEPAVTEPKDGETDA